MHSGGIQEGRRVGGKWIIERQLGAGGMGAIYIARHAEMPLRAALKNVLSEHVQREGARERFHREAQMMALVRSMHVVQIHDFGTDEETKDLFLVMELLEGEDLSKLLGRLGPLPPSLVARLLAQSLKGLLAAHAQGVVHRDIKPQNLFLARMPDGSRILKVLDFGIGRLLAAPDGPAQKKLTATHGAIGSPPYMSPEQLRASATVDQRTDLWSLGATGYELLCGKLPFSEANDFAELVRQIVFGNPEPLGPRAPWAAAELVAIVERCLQRDLGQRYPDAAAMATDLARLLGGTDQITEPMLVPLSEAERAAVGVRGAPVAVAGGTALMPAGALPFATGGSGAVGATPSTAAPMSAAPAPPMGAHGWTAAASAGTPGPLTTGAPVVTGAPLNPPHPAVVPVRRTSPLVAVALGVGLLGAGMGMFAILSSGKSASSSAAADPAPATDAQADAPAPVTPDAGPGQAEKGDAGSGGDAGLAPALTTVQPKTSSPKPAMTSTPRRDDPFGTSRQGQ